MALPYYVNSLDNGMRPQPNEYYRELQQAFYDSQWDNTSARITVQEQVAIGSSQYKPLEVWINKVIGSTTTFAKNGEDFRQLIFQDIDRPTTRGLYYIFENDYWIADFQNPSQGLCSDITVRRCNNALRIIDPENGSIFAIPCVVDYDATSPTMLINSSILTPNNHLLVYVQANDDTMRLFTLNKRFIIGGRAFKLLAFQNALNESLLNQKPTILYLELFLDEEHADDDLVNQVAYNGTYDYQLSIDVNSLELSVGSIGSFNTTITLNGLEVNREIVWTSGNTDVLTFDENGQYTVVGSAGQTVSVTASLEGNSEVKQIMEFTIVDQAQIAPVVVLNPDFDKIRQYQTIPTEVQVDYGGTIYNPDSVVASLASGSTVLTSQYLSLSVDSDIVQVTCLKPATDSQTIYITATNVSPAFTVQKQIEVQCVSMMG